MVPLEFLEKKKIELLKSVLIFYCFEFLQEKFILYC